MRNDSIKSVPLKDRFVHSLEKGLRTGSKSGARRLLWHSRPETFSVLDKGGGSGHAGVYTHSECLGDNLKDSLMEVL